jgi:Flp pilus assembly protein TadD
MKALILAVATCLASAAELYAVEAVTFSFEISQRDSTTGRDVLLYADTADVARGIPAVGFMAVMSVEIRLQSVDTGGASYSVQIVTASRPASTAAREIHSEFGLPLRLTDSKGKNGARYTLEIRPLGRKVLADGGCGVATAATDQFKFDPTAHTDMYFAKSTFGDYYWNLSKGLFETEYDEFNALVKFNVPGKYAIYMCPCPVVSVIWDDRFGQVIDPTRGTAHVLFAPNANSADPFVLLALAVYRQYGYAPAFLVDGFANIGSAALDEVKTMQTAGKNIAVAPLLDSYRYFSSDPGQSDAISAAFIKYLIATYSLDRFLTLYARSDDLNLQASIESTYGKPIADLETEFRGWVKSTNISLTQYEYCSNRAEAMFDYAGQRQFALKMKPLMVTKMDSARTLSALSRASFNTGDFYGATEAQRAYLTIDPSTPGWIALCGYQMMNGLYDSARADLRLAAQRDTVEILIKMNLGLCELFTGDTVKARDFLSAVASSGGSGAVEAKTILGHLYLGSRERAEQARAIPILQEAVSALQTRIASHDVNPSEQMWLGIAFLGLDDQSNALSALQLADFLETRPFYRGMISLWLGKAADLRGERDVALRQYNAVLSGASAHYTQVEARRYRDRAYTH